ncbi:MAG: hypothetical protein KatS3mg013_2134 [Actinomycetota bacterium]|jgi:PAS domain S-box-containing protein|nr:MAG: hypothetical protein KatS3mg013_2134 [Actinomycetota bacterium]
MSETTHALLHRGEVLDAVAYAAERFLRAADWRAVLEDVLARLGAAAGASRAYVVQDVAGPDGARLAAWVAEWAAPGCPRLSEDPAVALAPWFPRWRAILERGEPVVADAEVLPDEERAVLDDHGVVSVVAWPIVVAGTWWGCLGFDDRERPRSWTGPATDALRTAAVLLAAAIERERREAELRNAEARYRSFVETIPAVTYTDVVERGAPTRMGYVSPQIEQVLGYPPQAFIDDPGLWFRLIHPEDLAELEGRNAFDAADESTFDEEYRMIAADGREVWVHDTSIPIRDENGAVRMFQGFLVDVTARRLAEEELRQARERFRAIVEQIPAAVYAEVVAPGTTRAVACEYMSPRMEQILGYPVERWLADVDFWKRIVHEEDLDRVLVAAECANEEGTPLSVDYRTRHADGHVVWLHEEAVLLRDHRGRPTHWLGVVLDVTEHREAQARVAEAERMFRATVEHLPAIVYRESPVDAARSFYISPQVERFTGWTAEEWMREPGFWRRRIHPEDLERVIEADDRSDRTKEPYAADYRFLCKDGSYIWLHDEAVLLEEEGQEPFWQGFMIDVTERKRAEEQLEHALDVERQATARLRSLDEMKNTFLQAVSHDLRTPLAAILGLAITLERTDVELGRDEARDLAHRIAENARRLDRLVTNLLDLDRLARGIVTPSIEPTDVGALVRRVAADTQLIPEARLRFDLPSLRVGVDASKLERIVENLLANTARHTPADTTVWVAVERVEDGIVLRVDDDGPGVPEELREAIFEPFRQGPNAPSHAPGVGVGLTLVRRFAELHGGRAWVEERPGGGSSFRVFLPTENP